MASTNVKVVLTKGGLLGRLKPAKVEKQLQDLVSAGWQVVGQNFCESSRLLGLIVTTSCWTTLTRA